MTETHGGTAREGADPEDMTSGGSGGAQGTDAREDWDKDQKLGQQKDDQDVMTDQTGEPVTKPGASDQTRGSTPPAGESEGTQEP